MSLNPKLHPVKTVEAPKSDTGMSLNPKIHPVKKVSGKKQKVANMATVK